jgi:hypothetical protein
MVRSKGHCAFGAYSDEQTQHLLRARISEENQPHSRYKEHQDWNGVLLHKNQGQYTKAGAG